VTATYVGEAARYGVMEKYMRRVYWEIHLSMAIVIDRELRKSCHVYVQYALAIGLGASGGTEPPK
jgi:hypothetical protein